MSVELVQERIPEDAVVTLEVDSNPWVISHTRCTCHKKEVIQRKVDFGLNFNRRIFITPDTWAYVCAEGGEDVYLEPEVVNEMMNIIFEISYPERVGFDIA